MPVLRYSLEVRRPVPLMNALIEAFCGDAHLSLEGDLSKLNWAGNAPTHPRISAVLRRQTSWPKQDFAVLPLEWETIFEIKRSVLPVVGLAKRIAHVQIEQRRELVFGAYDEFHAGCTWITQRVEASLLDRLKRDGCLKSYSPNRYDLLAGESDASPEQYLVDLLTEQDVSLEEALRAFGADHERARRVINIYVGTGSVVLKDNGQDLPDWRLKELLRDPLLFDNYGHLCMTPGPTYARAREQGEM